MTPDRTPESVDPRVDAENVKINDLPMADATAEKVKGGLGPVDGKTTPRPYGPVDGLTTPKPFGPVDG